MMKSVTLSLLQSAANAFDFGGPVLCDAHHYGEGHINDTFVVWREDHSKRFICSASTQIPLLTRWA